MDDDCNKDELEAPEWMNESFFTEVLQKCEKDNLISIVDVKIAPATPKGDHFGSVMFRASIRYTTSELETKFTSLIIKAMQKVDGHNEEAPHAFQTEIGMYMNTIPRFEAELRRIGDNTVLGARLIYQSLTPRKCIVLEDIVPKGYATLRDRLANIEEVKAAFLKLAKWHAVSYKLAAEGDKEVRSYTETFLNSKGVEEIPVFTSGLTFFLEKVETIDELKQYVTDIQSIQKDLIKRCTGFFNTCKQPSATGLFALCHGDFHYKNMMFKRSVRGELEDVMLLDFQLCFYGPAVLDLVYGMYVLASEDLRWNHRDELIHFYSSNFIATLERLGFEGPRPKVADFYVELMRHRHWELFLFMVYVPFWYGMLDRSVDTEDLIASDDLRRKTYDNPLYVKELKRMLPLMFYRGFFDQV